MEKDTLSSPRAQTLVLFSDGTGNSSAKLFKTNVWRMYEAVDLGPSRRGDPVQIAYYDNGVGTQSIRFVAMLVGIFGIGLKRNVLRLYRFACRNAEPGCQIYCFGFSRGAFTIRLVAAILAQHGLVRYSNEAELKARTLDVFRLFMRSNNPNVATFLGPPARKLRDGLVAIKRWIFGPRIKTLQTVPANVRFVGVWDTVNAYGGPIAELTRGIDDYLWPLTMTDTCLNERVEIARHALSLDDERDAFQPVLWDEVNWAANAARQYPDDPDKQQEFRARMKQVWFAGVHSDVGGGYPDESLSYVSLYWMMEEAEAAGLRLLPRFKSRVRMLSNSLGPIHDSRAGLASYYRPQPRKIAAFLHPRSGDDFEAETLSLRDPVIGDLPKPPHGLLMGCTVHESVVTRLVEGTDDYAPATLPPKIAIEPYSSGLRIRGGHPPVNPAVSARLTSRDRNWYARQELIWDFVLYRRVAYFLTVAATLLLLTMPLWVEGRAYPDTADSRAMMERLTSWSRYAAPGFVKPWVRAFQLNPGLFFLLLAAAVAFSVLGGYLQGKARGRSYLLWQERIADTQFTLPRPGIVTRARNSAIYQRIMQVLKWRLLPALAALTVSAVAIWAAAAAFTQLFWSLDEPQLCKRSPELRRIGPAPQKVDLALNKTCNSGRPQGLWVERGHRYAVTFKIEEQWQDNGLPTWTARKPLDLSLVQLIGVPYRRVVNGDYLQPIYQIRPANSAARHPRMRIGRLDPIFDEQEGVFRDTMTATESGELFLFVNDAALLRERSWFYENNTGTAVVTVHSLDSLPSSQAIAEEEERP